MNKDRRGFKFSLSDLVMILNKNLTIKARRSKTIAPTFTNLHEKCIGSFNVVEVLAEGYKYRLEVPNNNYLQLHHTFNISLLNSASAIVLRFKLYNRTFT